MGKKILLFLAGVVTGVVLTIAVALAVASGNGSKSNGVDYFDQPISYENKTATSFKVFQVFDNAALANEISDEKYEWYHGKTVLILNGQFYSDQIVKIKKPMQVGTYSYKNNGGMPMTVPVIENN